MKLLIVQFCAVSSRLNADTLFSPLFSGAFIVCHKEVSVKIYIIMVIKIFISIYKFANLI
jgi:hypothetical protein